MMGRFSKHWTFWARIVWLFTGQAPDNAATADVLDAEVRALNLEILDWELSLIQEQHRIGGLKAQVAHIQRWGSGAVTRDEAARYLTKVQP